MFLKYRKSGSTVMMSVFICLAFAVCTLTVNGQQVNTEFPQVFRVSVANPADLPRKNILVHIPADQIRKTSKEFNPEAFVVLQKDQEIPSQFNSTDKQFAGIVLVLENMKPRETVDLVVRYKKNGTVKRAYPKRTQAELSHKFGGKFENREYVGGNFRNVEFLRVPKEHKDHSWFIRYEGPGWESDRVGYRFYLDQRNATDVFGKTTTDMILQNVGQDGFDSYHEMQDWGMDVMKVGKSLGVGSIGYIINGTVTRVEKTDSVSCRITENGPVYSSVLTKYSGWQIGNEKVDLESVIGIHAGERFTRQTLAVKGGIGKLCTGIVKDKQAQLIYSKGDEGHFGYLATYGKQSLNNDFLGLAVVFNPTSLIGTSEDQNSHLLELRVVNSKLEYYFLAAWEGEPNGIRSEDEFKKYLSEISAELAKPVQVSVRK